MRTLPSHPNLPLREAIEAGTDPIELLLASTLVVTHDGTLELRDDGTLPTGEPLPLGIARSGGGSSWLLGAYTDHEAVLAPDAPTAGAETPTVPVAGDDLVVLAASNHVGIHVNPGSDDDLVLAPDHVRELAAWLRKQRASSGIRNFDQHTLVTINHVRDPLTPDRRELLVRELAQRGASFAFVAEYALHGAETEPTEFTQLIVVGDEDGRADYRLREDARRVLWFLTGERTDSVAYDSMPQVRHVAQPILEPDGPLPEPLVGVV